MTLKQVYGLKVSLLMAKDWGWGKDIPLHMSISHLSSIYLSCEMGVPNFLSLLVSNKDSFGVTSCTDKPYIATWTERVSPTVPIIYAERYSEAIYMLI